MGPAKWNARRSYRLAKVRIGMEFPLLLPLGMASRPLAIQGMLRHLKGMGHSDINSPILTACPVV